MNSLAEKQRFIQTMATNSNYFNSTITTNHILEFLKYNPEFEPREAVRTTKDDSFFSIIQLYGYVQLGSDFYEMLIGMPRDYPHHSPHFLIGIDRQYCTIHDQQNLIKNHLITLQKNQKGDQYIVLRFPIIQKQWQPKNTTLNLAYVNIINIIKHPLLVRSKIQHKSADKFNLQKSIKSEKSIKNVDSKQANLAISSLYTDFTDLLISKNMLKEEQEKIDYSLCRNQFFNEIHYEHINNQMDKYGNLIQRQTQKVTEDMKEVEDTGKICSMLEKTTANEKQLEKLTKISQQQALKDAQISLRSNIEHSDSIKFADFKKVMKILYDRMFENQTEILRMK